MRYLVKIDGNWIEQDTNNGIFDRGSMAFWGFGLADVQPPAGMVLSLDPNKEPYFHFPVFI